MGGPFSVTEIPKQDLPLAARRRPIMRLTADSSDGRHRAFGAYDALIASDTVNPMSDIFMQSVIEQLRAPCCRPCFLSYLSAAPCIVNSNRFCETAIP